MTDLEQQLTDHLRRRAAAAIPRYDLEGIEQSQADAEDHDSLASPFPIDAKRRRGRSRLLAVVAAASILLALIGALLLLDDPETVDTTPATDPPTVSEPPPNGDSPTILATADDVPVSGVMELGGKTLSVHAVEQNGKITGEFRVNNLVVTLHCAVRNGVGDLILGGNVTEDPDRQSFALDPRAIGFDAIDVRVGDLFALIIRDKGPVGDRVSVYADDSAGSCTQLIDAAAQRPTDGGFFDYAGGDIKTEPFSTLDFAALADSPQFRVANVVVAIQCTGIKSTPDSTMRDLVLGGVVTDNPDNLATLDGVSVAVGDLLALIVREGPDDQGRRVTLYDNKQWFGGATISSCDELVESVPTWVDGGFFSAVFPGGYEVLPSAGTADPP